MSEETTAQPAKSPAAEARSGMAARFSAAGMPAEKSRDFRGSARRLGSQLRPERARVVTVLALAVASVSLSVLGPRLLGQATNVVVDGVISGDGVDFTKLAQVLGTVLALYVVSAS
jgi:ATP-binding cassette subfamily B protein